MQTWVQSCSAHLGTAVTATSSVILLLLQRLGYHCIKEKFLATLEGSDNSSLSHSAVHSTGGVPGSLGQFFTIFILVENHSTHAKMMCEFMRHSMASVNMCVKVC